jgi:hypothetical protein
VSEGLSAVEVGREAHSHNEEPEVENATPDHPEGSSRVGAPHERRNRLIHAAEATLLAVVTLVAAWSGYAAAKWNTESRVLLAKANTLRAQASRENLTAMELRNFDSSTFEAWFSAFVQNNATAEAIAVRRFRPEFKTAFDAWRATNPDTNPNAPPGPTYMPQYSQPDLAKANALDHSADTTFTDGERAGATADEYVRITVILAAVLFLVGIGSTFRVVGVRYALVSVGIVLLVFASVLILQQPRPPG